jgi:hypothetical protein
MKPPNRIVLYMLDLAVVAGCASTQVNQEQPVQQGWIAHRG